MFIYSLTKRKKIYSLFDELDINESERKLRESRLTG